MPNSEQKSFIKTDNVIKIDPFAKERPPEQINFAQPQSTDFFPSMNQNNQ